MVRDDGADSFKSAFGFPPRLPNQGFGRELQRRQGDRWAGDRSIALDQIGTDVFSARRSAQLAKIAGAENLASVYGLRTAGRFDTVEQPGLWIRNDNSPMYQRSDPKVDFQQQCIAIYRSQTGDLGGGSDLVFVHSKGAYERLRVQLKRRSDLADPILDFESLPEVRGLFAIKCRDAETAAEVRKQITFVGGTPSNYEVLKNFEAIQPPAREEVSAPQLSNDAPPENDAGPESGARLENDTLLKRIVSTGEDGPVAASAILPHEHPMRAVAKAEGALVSGLLTTFEATMTEPAFRDSPIIGNSLNMLYGLVASASTMAEDLPRFFSLYQAILDEIFIILAVARPYGEPEFKAAALDALKARAGGSFDSLQIAPPASYLVSTGMEAIVVGLEAGRTLTGTQSIEFLSTKEDDYLPDYFEVPGVISQERSSSTRVLAAVLNPSTPRRRADADPSGDTRSWDVETLIRQLQSRVAERASPEQPVVLVLDISVEKPGAEQNTSDLATLLQAYQADINEGRLKLATVQELSEIPEPGEREDDGGVGHRDRPRGREDGRDGGQITTGRKGHRLDKQR